ncbi:MAG TPA: beta-N-acetylhexosaminidase [Polyangia bacterium]|nr:beta-N-acetylhexosaminidase [Polyangia bacterium]
MSATGGGPGAALGRLCGQLLSVGFEGLLAPDDLRRRIAASDVGGVMLFRPNIAHPAQVATLVGALRGASSGTAPLLVSVDQEGGLVQRLRAPLTVWPDMLSVGSAGDAAATERVGRAVGDELGALGIAWDFAPVLDVHTNPQNPVIGNRAFGTTPEAVSTQALAFWRGLRAAGLVGCGKHFPGHGDTRTDSHHELPVVDHDIDRLRRIELSPFAVAAAAGMEAFMTAHVLYPALDPQWPATLSRRILTDLLRGQLGFRGVVVSDDLGMKAVAARYPIEELAVLSVLAGADHLLVREPVDRQIAAHEALIHAAEARSEVRARVQESAARMAALKALVLVGLPVPAAALPALLGRAEHRALAKSFERVSPDGAVKSSPVADS